MTFERCTIFPNGKINSTKVEIWDHFDGTEPEITDEYLFFVSQALKGFLEGEELLPPSEEREEILLLPGRLIFYSRVKESKDPLWTLFGPLWPLEATNSFINPLPLNGGLNTTSFSSLAKKTLRSILT